MKRSEMLKILYEETDSWNNSVTSVNLIDFLLDTIELAGMLQPTIKSESFKMLPSGEMIYNVNEWESENG